MAANQSQWPREWLMTDERLGDQLWEAITALPERGGIVFRHYGLSGEQRLALGRRVAEVAWKRNLVLAVAHSRALAEELDAALVHNPDRPGALPCSLAVHDEAEARGARSSGAVLALVSPVYPTRSHPNCPGLGALGAASLAAMAGCPAIALGGMNAERFRELQQATSGSFHGYAGIDCWLKT